MKKHLRDEERTRSPLQSNLQPWYCPVPANFCGIVWLIQNLDDNSMVANGWVFVSHQRGVALVRPIDIHQCDVLQNLHRAQECLACTCFNVLMLCLWRTPTILEDILGRSCKQEMYSPRVVSGSLEPKSMVELDAYLEDEVHHVRVLCKVCSYSTSPYVL